MEEREQNKGRGKLKIFLGFAAGVGKTYAMLEDAHAMTEKGVDVVAGYIEPHARPDTIAMAGGLLKIPEMKVNYKGIMLRELDVDACIKRHPEVLLVDELAHTNAEECRHQKRYQDIEEILEAGINVYTTVNIQHLESLNDLVTNITKIKVKERIPDSIFDEADQVEVVDIEPDDLIKRLKEGKVYKENQALKALENFFAREKLAALREIALRRMADRMNRLAEEEQLAGRRQFYVGEHILTCVSPSPSNAKVIRTASRLAYAFHGEFTAIFVETPEIQNAGPKTKKMLEENLQLARDLGAKITTIYGEDVSYQIAEYAKISNVSKVVIGRANRRFYIGRPKGTLVEQLTKYAPNLDIYVIPDAESYQKKVNARITRIKKEKLTVGDTVRTIGILIGCVMAGRLFQLWKLSEADIIMIHLLGVLLCSMYTNGRIYSIVSSIFSVLLYNFFFTVPVYSLKADAKSYPITFLIMFLVAFITSSLTTKMRRQNREMIKKSYRTELLLDNSRKLRRANSSEEVIQEIANQTLKLLNLPVLIYYQQNGKMVGPKMYPRIGMTEADMKEYMATSERTVAQWVFNNHHRAGTCTSTLPGAKAIYLPVQDNENVYAVVGVVLEERREIPSFEYGLLSTMRNEAALVLAQYK